MLECIHEIRTSSDVSDPMHYEFYINHQAYFNVDALVESPWPYSRLTSLFRFKLAAENIVPLFCVD